MKRFSIIMYIIMAVMSFTGCQTILMRVYGVRMIDGFKEKDYAKFIASIPEDIDYLSIIGNPEQFKLVNGLTADKIWQHALYQPVLILYFKGDSLVSIHYNCAVKSNGIRVDWNWKHDFDEFPPIPAVSLDGLELTRNQLASIYPEVSGNESYSIVFCWTNMMTRYSKTALREICENLKRFGYEKDTKLYLINNDLIFSELNLEE